MNTRQKENNFIPIIFYFLQITEINKYKANEVRLREKQKKKEQIEEIRKED